MKYEVLLYYKYATIKNTEKFAADHRAMCEKLGLKGRIIIAQEGINGTVEGVPKNTRAYREFLSSKRGFGDIHWKKSPGTGSLFPRLSVRVRDEIVSLSLKKLRQTDVDPRKVTGIHLSPKDLNAWFRKGERFTIIDMRNDYEHKVGHSPGQSSLRSRISGTCPRSCRSSRGNTPRRRCSPSAREAFVARRRRDISSRRASRTCISSTVALSHIWRSTRARISRVPCMCSTVG